MLNLGLDVVDKAVGVLSSPPLLRLLGDERCRAAVLIASAVSVSLGSALIAAVAAFFLPIALAVLATAAAMFATLAPSVLAVGWVLACTGPACEQLWRPLLVSRDSLAVVRVCLCL